MKLSNLKSNSTAREQGDWVRDIPDMGDLAIKTRGLRNSDANKLSAALIEALPRKEKRGKLSMENRDRMNTEVLVETCVLDWNLQNDDGTPIPFSKEELRKLLEDPDYIDFRDACLLAATMVAEREEEEGKEDVKN